MIRISKLTDYGIAVMVHFAQEGAQDFLNAREVSKKTNLPLPTVSKVLKTLLAARLLTSQRGVSGGYQLDRAPEKITMREIVEAFEGSLALTDCSIGPGICAVESHCATRSNWQKINRVIRGALDDLTLRDMAKPLVFKKTAHHSLSPSFFAHV
jgi:FeS assembly SUF system regulator